MEIQPERQIGNSTASVISNDTYTAGEFYDQPESMTNRQKTKNLIPFVRA